MTTLNSAIMEGTKYESSGAASTARSMVTQRWRSCDMSTIRIPLNSRKYPGLYALIDEADYELVSQYQWYPKVASTGPIYAATSRPTIRMHRMILAAPEGMQVDHINGDALDNRRCNLRLATAAENRRNTPQRTDNTSGYKGVRWKDGAWVAYVRIDGVPVSLGYFRDIVAAASAYDYAAMDNYGEFAKTNVDLGLLDESERLSREEVGSRRNVRVARSGVPNVYIKGDSGLIWSQFSHNGQKVWVGQGFDSIESAERALEAKKQETQKAKESPNG